MRASTTPDLSLESAKGHAHEYHRGNRTRVVQGIEDGTGRIRYHLLKRNSPSNILHYTLVQILVYLIIRPL